MAPTALITGASGLLGSWTLRHWTVPDLHPVAVRSGDVNLLEAGAAKELLARATPAVVVHLAWCASGRADYRSSPDNERWTGASVDLARACIDTGVLLWLTGTVVDGGTDAPDAYSRAKARLRQELRFAIDENAIGWLRPHYVFDEERRRPGLVQHALQAREKARTVELRSPERRHDFVHASDVGAAVVSAVTHRLRGVVPIGSGRTRRVSDLVDALGVPWNGGDAANGSKITHEDAAADVSRLRALGWKPSRTEEFFTHV